MDRQGALEGIKVLDISRMLPGPFCTMVLADHGARVISIEDRRFESEGSFPPCVHRNKEHMTLNLKTDEGKKIFYRLAEGADVVVEGFRPGVAARLGVDYETLKKINPGLIYCAISGYGQTGPLKDSPGHDVNYLGVSGLLDQIGPKDGAPVIPGFQIADIAGGGMHGVAGILLALFARTRTGRGQFIDISMTDCCLPMHAVNLDLLKLTGESPARSDGILSHGYAFYNTFETKDGRFLAIGALEPRFWKALCEHLGVPHLVSLQLDGEKRGEIIETLSGIFKEKSLEEWAHDLEPIDTCWSQVNTMEEALASDLFLHRKMVVEMTDKKGASCKTFGVPIKLSATPGNVKTPPMAFGASTAAILSELGLSGEKIKSLLDKEVI